MGKRFEQPPYQKNVYSVVSTNTVEQVTPQYHLSKETSKNQAKTVRINIARTLENCQRSTATKKMLKQEQGNFQTTRKLCNIFTCPCHTLLSSSVAVLKMAAHTANVGPCALVLEGSELNLFLKNGICLLVSFLPGSCLKK